MTISTKMQCSPESSGFLRRLAFAILGFTVVSGCGKTMPRPTMLENEKIVLKAMTPSRDGPVHLPLTNLRTVIEVEGKSLDSSSAFEILFFKTEGDYEPLYRFNTEEYAKAVQSTKCKPDILARQEKADAAVGIFCNASMNLSLVHSFVLKRPGKNDLTATGAVPDYEDPATGLRSVVIPF